MFNSRNTFFFVQNHFLNKKTNHKITFGITTTKTFISAEWETIKIGRSAGFFFLAIRIQTHSIS